MPDSRRPDVWSIGSARPKIDTQLYNQAYFKAVAKEPSMDL